MRVLVLTHNYPRFPGDAAGAFIARLAQGAVRAGCDVRVLAPHAAGLAEESADDGGIPVRRFRYAPEMLELLAYRGDLHYRAARSPLAVLALPFFLAAFRRAALRAVGEFPPDVIHAHWWLPAGRVAARLGRPYVLTCHGTDVRLLDQYPLLRRSAAPVFARARAVTAVSSFLAADICRLLPGVARVTPTPMPLDVALFERGRAVPKASPARILFVGNLIPSKGVDVLIRAARLLRERGPAFRVRVVGDGPERSKLSRLARAEGVADLLDWAGRLPQTVMPEEYGAATVTVLPSRGQAEGLGLVLAEALLAGSAVIGSPAGGIPEVVTHEETGLIANGGDPGDLANQLYRVLTERELRQRTAAAGRERVRRAHAIERALPAFLEIYRVAAGLPQQ